MAREQEEEERKIGLPKKKKSKNERKSALPRLNRERAGKEGGRGERDKKNMLRFC